MSEQKSQIGLACLLSPMALDTFLEDTWPHEPLVAHGLSETVSELVKLPFLQSLENMLGCWPYDIQAHLPDVKDESHSIDVNAVDARKVFQNQLGLLFNNVQRISPVLVKWLAAIKTDLGLPNSSLARCLVYATPNGKGTAAHFDQNINFVLQIHGTKKWWLAPNEVTPNPTERHTIGQPLDPELASYALDEMPLQMPESSHEIELKPGSMLFVPRGWWHRTEAAGEALALNFTYSQPTWVDLLTVALRSRLQLSPEWRELADGVGSLDPARRLQAQSVFDLRLQELIEDLPNWQAADILSATEL